MWDLGKTEIIFWGRKTFACNYCGRRSDAHCSGNRCSEGVAAQEINAERKKFSTRSLSKRRCVQRKWQDARIEREYEEKRKAEEILKQRRQEHARLSSYIYSSSQNGDRRYVNRPQGNKKCIHDGNMQPKKMMDGYSKDIITEKDSTNKDNEVCCLSSDPTITKPCDLHAWSQGNKICAGNKPKLTGAIMGGDPMDTSEKRTVSEGNSVGELSSVPITDKHCDLQTWHSHRTEDETEAATDILEEALQERLENELATSALIAELTDMKSRLDDCLLKPIRDDLSADTSVRTGFENCTDFDHGAKLSDVTDDQETCQWWESTKNGDDLRNALMFKKEESLKDLEDCTDSDPGAKISEHTNEHDEFQFCEPRNKNDQTNALMLRKDESHFGSNYGAFHMNIDNCGRNLSSVVNFGNKINGRYGNMEGKLIGQKGDLAIDRRNASVSPLALTGSVEGYEKCSCSKENRGSKVLHRVLQESDKQSHSSNKSDQSKTKQNAKANTTDSGAESKPNKQKSKTQSLLSCWSKSSNILSTLNPAQACQGSYAKRDTLSSQNSRKPMHSYMKNKKLSSKDIGFSDHEESILASIERLDVKLAIVSAKMSNSSRTSFISDELQSLKSAPPLMKHKQILQRKGELLASKRRQNVGLTNMSKDKTNEFQCCTLQKPWKLQDHSVKDHSERRQASDGTIILHQNAEFLFS